MSLGADRARLKPVVTNLSSANPLPPPPDSSLGWRAALPANCQSASAHHHQPIIINQSASTNQHQPINHRSDETDRDLVGACGVRHVKNVHGWLRLPRLHHSSDVQVV
eukprot:791539-Prorocentrum_minimum.AAC.1